MLFGGGDDKPIGECWIQKMNMPDVTAMYPETMDVRRIDMAIGEKDYWGKGIGTIFIRMLIDFAFCGEKVDVLHCFSEDYNPRSMKMWEKNGFTQVQKDKLPDGQKGKWQLHYALSKKEFIESRRNIIPRNEIICLPITELFPSQLYISQGKYDLALEWFDKEDINKLDPIPIKYFMDKTLMMDGHTRAVMAYNHGFREVPCYIDHDELNMDAYAMDIKWCECENVCSITDLAKRIVPHNDYERLWRKRCIEKC